MILELTEPKKRPKSNQQKLRPRRMMTIRKKERRKVKQLGRVKPRRRRKETRRRRLELSLSQLGQSWELANKIIHLSED